MAENANEYIRHVIDEDGNELAWNYFSDNGYANPEVAAGGKYASKMCKQHLCVI